METIAGKIMERSRYHEGDIPTDWEFVGMQDNGAYYIRYYRDAEGNYRHTSQKRKRKEPYGKLALREDEAGRTFARRIYPKRKTKRKMA